MIDKIELLILMVFILGVLILGCFIAFATFLKGYVTNQPQVIKKLAEDIKFYTILFWLIWVIGIGTLILFQ